MPKVDLDAGFTDQVATLNERFDAVTAALQKGDTTQLQRALEAVMKIAEVLIFVLGAINQAKTKR